MTGYFSTAYLPSIGYFKKLLHYEKVGLESFESWQKQTYRNRCYILGPQGRQMLNIPVVHNEQDKYSGTIEISYRENWQRTHWQAIKTAYGSSPFFEILGPELEPFYQMKIERLMDWNTALLKLLLHWLQVDIDITFSENWQSRLENDHREDFHPKKKDKQHFEEYLQVFANKGGFEANLSVIDLLFNEGPASFDYLKS